MNIEVDLRAKAYLIKATENDFPVQIKLENEPWSVWVKGKKLTKDLKSAIYDLVHAGPIHKYWTGRKQLQMNTTEYENIDWVATEKAMKASKQTRGHWILSIQ